MQKDGKRKKYMINNDFVKKNNGNILELQNHRLADGSEVPLLHFPLLDQTGIVEHCFTTRRGGVSEDIFSTMNLSFTRGDKEEAVLENYRRLGEAMGVSPQDFVCTDQTHTTNVLRVGKEDCGNGVTKPRPYTDVDGLVTNETGVVLSTFFADCVPLYFVDPVHRAIGMSHSGWRGTVGRMGARTLEKMQEEFGTEAKDVIAAVGPSICQECYEVSRDVAEEFQKEFKGHESEILIDKGKDKFLLDLWKCNEIVMLEAGILKGHLAVTNICTCCNPTLLFSHRASKGRRGNLGAFIFLKKGNDSE